MPEILCPSCGAVLTQADKQWFCRNGHSFDVARQGYVNLLPVTQKHSLHPGDTREQVAARRAFLDAGFYAPLAKAVCRTAVEYTPTARAILDVGCGEGYYSAQIAHELPQAALYGLDISKDAVRLAAGRYKSGVWLCATAAHLPFPEHSFDLLISMFSLTVPKEFHRVLTPGGIFLQVLAAEDHLLSLKQTIYPQLLHREKTFASVLPGFTLAECKTIDFSFTVQDAQIQNLLAMTPHVWRITRQGAERLAGLERLTDRASVVIQVYRAG